MTYKLKQWAVTVDGVQKPLFTPLEFTPLECEAETAMAMAVETYGPNVTALADEGVVKCSLSHAQMHIADKRWCEGCGEWISSDGSGHDEGCPKCE